jgi:hypothetical protein
LDCVTVETTANLLRITWTLLSAAALLLLQAAFFYMASHVHSIASLSGRWTGFSKPADASKPPTEWANTFVNFDATPESPGILNISGRGSSLFQGEEIHFHLVGTVDSRTFAFELFKTHTGRFVHTLVYRGVLDPTAQVWRRLFVEFLSYLLILLSFPVTIEFFDISWHPRDV